MTNEIIDTFFGGQVTSNEIIVIFLGWPVTRSEIIVIFLRNSEVIITFLSNDAHLCVCSMNNSVLTRTRLFRAA
jgi:hypothetical protein